MLCRLWNLLYNAAIGILLVAIHVIAPLFPKLRTRKKILRQQRSSIEHLATNTSAATIWFHAASMGELEQIKPLVRLYRENMPHARIVVSVFSPSAYRRHSDLPNDAFVLLPYDSSSSARHFVEHLNPRLVIVSRYDLWWNITQQLAERKIKLVLVNATFPSTPAEWLMRGFYRCLYSRATLVIARSERHAAAFRRLKIDSTITVSPDTRIDQIALRAANALTPPPFLQQAAFRLVLGSTWSADEALWADVWRSIDPGTKGRIQLIIAPHEPTSKHCHSILRHFPDSMLLSQLPPGVRASIVIVDRVGMLTELYHHASAAYIGGGFGAGVHSVLEAAFAGIPISCGPRIKRSDDAHELQSEGVLRILHTPDDAQRWLTDVMNGDQLSKRARSVQENLKSRTGVSKKIYELIEQMR